MPDYLIFDEIVSVPQVDRLVELFALWQKERRTMPDTSAPTVEICSVHNTPMVREREHVGDGQSRWSIGYCPLCAEIAAKKEAAKLAEPQPATEEEQ